MVGREDLNGRHRIPVAVSAAQIVAVGVVVDRDPARDAAGTSPVPWFRDATLERCADRRRVIQVADRNPRSNVPPGRIDQQRHGRRADGRRSDEH